MLLQAVQRQLCLIIHKYFERLNKSIKSNLIRDKRSSYIGHELLARHANFLRQSSAEHHDLFVMGSSPENFLHVTTHVW
jgi:hypothetical protein